MCGCAGMQRHVIGICQIASGEIVPYVSSLVHVVLSHAVDDREQFRWKRLPPYLMPACA